MSAEAAEPGTSSDASNVPTQLTSLVPSFDPTQDDLEQYVQKVEMLCEIWPSNKLSELATRLILNAKGAGFQKLQLKRKEVITGSSKGIKQLVEILGGHRGKVQLERKYEVVERAIFRCSQKQDECNDSYIAGADILWTELLAKGMTLQEIQSYVLLRGSLLSHDGKKRVILESDVDTKGQLDVGRVTQAIRMLGSGFFTELTGQRKSKGKVYDAHALTVKKIHMSPSIK